VWCVDTNKALYNVAAVLLAATGFYSFYAYDSVNMAYLGFFLVVAGSFVFNGLPDYNVFKKVYSLGIPVILLAAAAVWLLEATTTGGIQQLAAGKVADAVLFGIVFQGVIKGGLQN